MNKKNFISGIAVGVAASVMSFVVLNTASLAMANTKGGEIPVWDKINYISALLDDAYVDGIDFSDITEGLFKGMVSSVGDPYTSYMTASEFSEFSESTNGSFYGVGVTLLTNVETNTLTVVSVMEGLSADLAGVQPGDIIKKVDGVDVTAMDSDAIISMIKGEEGTDVIVSFERDGKVIDFDLTRVNVEVASVGSQMLEDNIGYIQLVGFKANTYEQFKEEYDELIAEGAEGLIIDLRDNPGGVLDTAVDIADELMGEGIVVYTEDKNGERIDYTSDENCISIPLVLLVNGNSASASEVLSGAVQDSGTGVLVGTQTFGKGLVQRIYPLSDGSAVKVTIQKYYTPNGVCIHGDGITPDYVVEFPEDSSFYTITDMEDDVQLTKAIEIIKEDIK